MYEDQPVNSCASRCKQQTRPMLTLGYSFISASHERSGGGSWRLHSPSSSLILHKDHHFSAITLVDTRLITFEMEPEAVAIIETEATDEAPPPARTKYIISSRVADDGTLTVHSKRNKRRRRKQPLKQPNPLNSSLTLLHLPFDVLIQVLCLLRPSDNFRLA